jgi:hypothetical protein
MLWRAKPVFDAAPVQENQLWTHKAWRDPNGALVGVSIRGFRRRLDNFALKFERVQASQYRKRAKKIPLARSTRDRSDQQDEKSAPLDSTGYGGGF